MKKAFFAVLVLLACLACSSHQQTDVADAASEESHPHLKIEAQPRQGFAPLIVSFVVTLDGVGDNDEKFYCMKEEWDFGDGAVTADKPNCPPYSADTKVTKEFTIDHTYNDEGTFTARFRLGDHLKSAPISLNVLENNRQPGR